MIVLQSNPKMDQKLWVSMGLLLLNVVGFAVMLGGIIVLQSTCKGTNQPKVKSCNEGDKSAVAQAFLTQLHGLALCRSLEMAVSWIPT